MRKILSLSVFFLLCLTAGAEDFENIHGNKALTSVLSVNTSGTQPKLIDLGLSVLWADRNYGSESPTDYGVMYGWGAPASEFYNSTYPTINDIRETEYDICHSQQKNFRMPSYDELEELRTKCSWTYTVVDGIAGFNVVGPSGSSIFIPAAGVLEKGKISERTDNAFIWSGVNKSGSKYASCLHIHSKTYQSNPIFMSYTNKEDGVTVRAVASYDDAFYPLTVIIDGLEYTLYENQTAKLNVQQHQLAADITIPEYVNCGKKKFFVNTIADNALRGHKEIVTLNLMCKVTEIGPYVFEDCSGLTSVTIPDGITSIGYHAFSNCTGLTSVTIPNSVTDIGGDAFAGCSGLRSVAISNSVTSIGDGAFYICRGLTEVTIPNSVKFIGNLAFAGCSGLRSVTISNSLTAIGIKVFYGCSSLTSVTIPQSVTSIGNYAFDGCTDLKEVYILNSTPPSADRSSFDEQNYKNATLYVPEEAYETYDNMTDGPWKYFLNLQGIEMSTFYFDYDDNNMTATITGVNKNKLSSELVIPETTTYNGKTYTVAAIGDDAFRDCSGLTSVTIPNSITAIGMNVFSGCI
ncbi:MAG: leucine-rich repeat domain-containing protein [Prevotella sp.]|nr:leucine-rich repeat domain-containing protein [Prevotella sp.]